MAFVSGCALSVHARIERPQTNIRRSCFVLFRLRSSELSNTSQQLFPGLVLIVSYKHQVLLRLPCTMNNRTLKSLIFVLLVLPAVAVGQSLDDKLKEIDTYANAVIAT